MRWTVLAVVAALALAAGCVGDDGGSGSGGDSDKPVKVGVSLPLTGEFSEPGKAAKKDFKI